MAYRRYKYRLYPTRQQAELLNWTLACCCELYNAALQERRDAWRINCVSVGYYEQAAQLPAIKAERLELSSLYTQVLQDTLRRVDKAFRAFFRRVKQKAKAGYPRFRSITRYDSFTYPQNGFSIRENKLLLSKIGKVKIKLHRAIEGKIKTCTIKREAGRWYVVFCAECESKPLPPNSKAVGIDVGLSAFATLSDGAEIENPCWFKNAQAKLRRAQRKVSRRKKGSRRRLKAVLSLQRVNAHIKNQRADFHHKISRLIVNKYGLIAVEDLNIKGLAKSRLAGSILDAGWSNFFRMLTYKAEDAGRVLVKVDPRGTSQRCVCGNSVPKKLSERRHECENCGLKTGRDHAAALEILRLGLSHRAPTQPVSAYVA